ncbi:MAG: hypothetical protein DRJ61_08985 [Acidobacteria bacterium]|nr:MAG: hypothetical protein DRJ61_08985 [Acidobacteriota bacterium]
MPIHLRRALADDDVEVPDHFEGVSLKGTVRLSGWLVGLILAVGGIALMVLSAGTLIEALGVVSAAAGVILLAAVIRCRRYETQIGRRWITIGAGPFTRRIRSDLVAGHELRAATGWRRLYADHEVVLTLNIEDHQHIVPTRDGEGLGTSLG